MKKNILAIFSNDAFDFYLRIRTLINENSSILDYGVVEQNGMKMMNVKQEKYQVFKR